MAHESYLQEWQQAVAYHLGWWRQIVDERKREGVAEMAIGTEFGAPAYLPTLPYTRQPVVDLWDINKWMLETRKTNLHEQDLRNLTPG